MQAVEVSKMLYALAGSKGWPLNPNFEAIPNRILTFLSDLDLLFLERSRVYQTYMWKFLQTRVEGEGTNNGSASQKMEIWSWIAKSQNIQNAMRVLNVRPG